MNRATDKAKFSRPDADELEMELATPADMPHHEHGPGMHHLEHESEQAREHSRQQAMAAQEKATRTRMPVGQNNTMRVKMGNQPRGGR
jgi:hypothetical protein